MAWQAKWYATTWIGSETLVWTRGTWLHVVRRLTLFALLTLSAYYCFAGVGDKELLYILEYFPLANVSRDMLPVYW